MNNIMNNNNDIINDLVNKIMNDINVMRRDNTIYSAVVCCCS